ncbi:MAG: acyl-CoA thioesterase [Polyangiaceae bacterium]
MSDLLVPRSPSESIATMTEVVLPVHTNALGGIFGGQIVAWMDLCAAICAQRHANARVVTAGIDELTFERTVKAGQIVRLTARPTAAFRSSMEIFVDVHGEDAVAGETWPTVSAYLTFVAVDSSMKPIPVRPLLLTTPEEREAEAAAHERRTARLGKRRK